MVLETLFGSRATERILLHIFHYGEIHARGIAGDYNSAVSPFIRQLGKLEDIDLAKCTEEELWKYVGYHLSKAGIESGTSG